MLKRLCYLVKVALSLSFLFSSSSYLRADSFDEALFKLYINKQPYKPVSVLVDGLGEHYICISELLLAMGYFPEIDTTLNTLKCNIDTSFFLNIEHSDVEANGNKQEFNDRLIWDDSRPFIRIESLSEALPLDAKIYSASLAVYLTTTVNIPKQRLLEQSLNRQRLNAKNLTVAQPTDTVPIRRFRINSLGYYINRHFKDGFKPSDYTRSNLNGEILGGTFKAQHQYSSVSSFEKHTLTLEWNKANISKKWLKQLSVFRSHSKMILNSFGYYNGIYVSNQPYTKLGKKSYLLKGVTTPNTNLEIYNNGQFIDYLTSDSLGNYHAEIPVGSGNNKIKTVVYDNLGNFRSDDQLVYISSRLQQPKEFAYHAASGVTDSYDPFAQAYFDYGLTRFLTLTSGTEWLIENGNTKWIPILGAKGALTQSFHTEVSFIPTVRWDVNGYFHIKKLISIDYLYESYQKGQNLITYAPERKYIVGLNSRLPFKFQNNVYLSLQNFKYTFSNIYSVNLRLSVTHKNLYNSFNIYTNSFDKLNIKKLSFELFNGYRFSPNFYAEISNRYDNLFKEYQLSGRLQWRKQDKFDSYVETGFSSNGNAFRTSLGLTWYFGRVQVSSSTSISKYSATFSSGIGGSVYFRDNGNIELSNSLSQSATLFIVPFIDKNGDGKYAKDEPIYKDLKLNVGGTGYLTRNRRGIQINSITPMRSFEIIIQQQSLDDISWQVESCKHTLLLRPNQVYTLYIPIKVVSEVSGQLRLEKSSEKKLTKIKVTATNSSTQQVYTAYCDEWGYYSFENLTSGEYLLEVCDETLRKRGLSTKKEGGLPLQKITIASLLEGEQFNDVDFILE